MAEYVTRGTFTALAAVDTEDCFISILPPANVSIKVKRIAMNFGTATADICWRIRLRRVSTAQSGTTTAITPVAKRTGAPASVCTCVRKNAGTTVTPGTNVDLLLDICINGKGTLEWVARDPNDYLHSGVNQRVQLTVLQRTSNAANQFCEIEWIE